MPHDVGAGGILRRRPRRALIPLAVSSSSLGSQTGVRQSEPRPGLGTGGKWNPGSSVARRPLVHQAASVRPRPSWVSARRQRSAVRISARKTINISTSIFFNRTTKHLRSRSHNLRVAIFITDFEVFFRCVWSESQIGRFLVQTSTIPTITL